MQRLFRRPVAFSLFSLIVLAVVTANVRADEPAARAGDSTVVTRAATPSILAGFLDVGYARVSREDWTSPRKFQISRAPAVYSRMYPERFYGQAGPPTTGPIRHYSIIPMPTDTTQLGYYYRRVPSWQPRRMLPPIPRPSRWHDRTPIPSMRSRDRVPAQKATPAAPRTQAGTVRNVIR